MLLFFDSKSTRSRRVAGQSQKKICIIFNTLQNDILKGRAESTGFLSQIWDNELQVRELQERVTIDEKKANLAKDFNIRRETIYQYLKISELPETSHRTSLSVDY